MSKTIKTIVKIPVEIYKEGAILCKSTDCKFRKECANHETAGDFRFEDGFTPALFEEGGKVFCQTYSLPIGEFNEPIWSNDNKRTLGALIMTKGDFKRIERY